MQWKSAKTGYNMPQFSRQVTFSVLRTAKVINFLIITSTKLALKFWTMLFISGRETIGKLFKTFQFQNADKLIAARAILASCQFLRITVSLTNCRMPGLRSVYVAPRRGWGLTSGTRHHTCPGSRVHTGAPSMTQSTRVLRPVTMLLGEWGRGLSVMACADGSNLLHLDKNVFGDRVSWATCPLTCITTPAASPRLTRVWMVSVTLLRNWILRCVPRTVTTTIKVSSLLYIRVSEWEAQLCMNDNVKKGKHQNKRTGSWI